MSDYKGICAMRPFASHTLVKWLCGLIFICAFATAHAEDSERNHLQRVDVREGDRATEISVVGTQPPTFTVFKLSAPIRLFIDISNADASQLSGPIDIENGVVSQITPLQFNDKLVSIGRLIVSLNKDALYSVKAVGNELIVKVDATERQTLQALSAPPSQAQPGEFDAEMRGRAEAAERQAKLAQQTAQNEAALRATAEERAQKAEAEALKAQALAAEASQKAEAEVLKAQAFAAAASQKAEAAEQALAQLKAEEATQLAQAGNDNARTQARLKQAEREAAEAKAQAEQAQKQAQLAEARAAKAEQNARLAESQADQAEESARKAERMAQLKLQDAERQATTAKLHAEALENELKQAKQARLDAEARTRQAEELAQKAAQQTGSQSNTAKLAEARAAEAEARAIEAEAEVLAQNALSEASDREAESRVRHAESLAAQAQLQAEQQAARAKQANEAHAEALKRLQEAEARANEAENQSKRLNATRSEREKWAQDQTAAALARAAEAETKARAAEAKAQAAEAQAKAALAQTKAAEAEQQRLSQEAVQAREQIARLQATQKETDARLAQAKAQKDQHATAQLEAEKRAADAALQAKQAHMQMLESQQQNAALNTRASELEEAIRLAKESDHSAEAANLQRELSKLSSEAAALRKELAQRDAALASARKDADTSRKEAKRLQKALAKEKKQAQRNAAPAYAVTPRQAPAALTGPAQITDVRFEDDDKGSRIRISLTGEAKPRIHREGERTRVLELDSALIDPAIERSLDTGDFDSAVRLVSSFQAPPPGDKVRIVVTLAENVDDQISTKQGELTWDFARPTSPVVASALPYAAPRAAAYTHLAAPKISQGDTVNRLKTKHYTGKKINIDIKDGDIHNVLRLLAKEGNINIVTSDQVSGTVTLHLKLVPWDQVLDLVLKSKGLDMVREGDIVRIGRREDIHAEIVAEAEKNVVQEKLKPINIRLITASHASASDLVSRVRSMMTKDRGTAEYDTRTNTIILKDTDDVLDAVEDMIRRLDTQTPQVLIEARIVEVNVNESLNLGIQWGGDATFSSATGNATGLRFPSSVGIYGGATDGETPLAGVVSQPNFAVNLPAATGTGSGGAVGFSFGSIDSAFNLNVRLSASETEGTAKIVSSPKITTLDNVEATIMQGTSIPISQVSAAGVQTTFYDAVLKLTVKPTVTQDGNIYLNIRAENNTPDFQNTGARGDPTILKKEATTQLLLKDGDTTVIGGIYTSQSGHNRSAVPYLSHIPILGALFRNYSESDYRTELLVFVTPRIVNRAAATVRTTP